MKEYIVPLGEGTNQRAEMLAVSMALSKLKGEFSQYDVTVVSASDYAAGCLTSGWNPRANLPLVDGVRELVSRCGAFTLIRPTGEGHHKKAQDLAREASRECVLLVHADSGDPFACIPDVYDPYRTKEEKQDQMEAARVARTVTKAHKYGTGKTHEVVCGRCQGSGQFRDYGVCYRCEGKGHQTVADKRRNWGWDINNLGEARS